MKANGSDRADWKAIQDEREKYAAYLCSREWAEKRRAVLDRCKGVCERCGIHTAENVHHLTYARKFGEDLSDLAAWCRACHEFIHGKMDIDPLIERDWMRQQAIPLGRSLSESNLLEASKLLCPVCGYENCHIGRPVYHDGNDNYEAPWDGRGSLIVVPVWGECNHEWEMCFGFHKGTSFAFTRTHRDSPVDEEGEPCSILPR